MACQKHFRWACFLFLCAAPAGCGAPAPASGTSTLQGAFAAAAREFAVPEGVLLSLSYNLSRWEHHGGAPSFSAGYGPMHLTHMDRSGPALPTLDRAAELLGRDPAELRHDPAQNIRGGAALLSQYARETLSRLPADPAGWYGAVARYTQSDSEAVAVGFADQVYATLRSGQRRTLTDGQIVVLSPLPILPDLRTLGPLHLSPRKPLSPAPECPADGDCEFIPAAYQLNPSPPGDYGNYDLANRPDDGQVVRYIVIHDTEVNYAGTLRTFQDPMDHASAHYVVRSSDGHIAQMIPTSNVAWHAGNWYVNMHSIGIEHEGFAIEGATWYTEALYQASARLVRYLGWRFGVPLDRAHIVGHEDVPGTITTNQAGMHWDPGPFWDWAHYMDLVTLAPPDRAGTGGPVVTIWPDFASNQPHLTYCYDSGMPACRDVPAQGASFVYLHTDPDESAPLITNPYLGSSPTHAENWGNKAPTGQRFVLADRQGEWDAIFFSGQKAWFYNPGAPDHRQNTISGTGTLVTPRAGLPSIPVYGRAYPEAGAYPMGVSPNGLVPIYTIRAGQFYVATHHMLSDYYRATGFAATLPMSNHVLVSGTLDYYQIFFNHRFAFVMASDVEVLGPDPHGG